MTEAELTAELGEKGWKQLLDVGTHTKTSDI